ncbi:MAG: HigA family addiction module antitoxin [Rhodospirillales bacterium]|nr:HigA family addiction module antitoxin [Rhodospirillales bacterium]
MRTPQDDLLANPHPGEILLEDFLKPMGLSQNALARAVHVPPRRINELVLGKRAVSADTDLRLARYFGLSKAVFLGLQSDYDLQAITPRAARERGSGRTGSWSFSPPRLRCDDLVALGAKRLHPHASRSSVRR